MANAVQDAWPGPVDRVDVYRAERVAVARGGTVVKAGFALRTLRTVLRRRPGVVLCLHHGLLPVGHLAARLSRARVAVLGHGLEVWAPLSPFEARLIRACSVVLAVSRFTAYWMARRACLPEERIEVVPLPVTGMFADMARSAPPASGGRAPIVLSVSRVVSDERYKGHFDIARAMPELLSTRPALWVVVGGGDDLPRLALECERLGVSDAVELRGRVNEHQLLSAYREAAIFVLPSQADAEAMPPIGEGFGLVYAEAAACGIPSVASTAGGGALDLLEDEVTGLLVPPDDPVALARAMRRLLSDDRLRKRLGQAARRRVQERHLPEQFADRIAQVLGAEAGSAGRGP